MTDESRIAVGQNLRHMSGTQGYEALSKEIEDRRKEAIERLIKLPAEKITVRVMSEIKAAYNELGGILEWVEEMIADGEQAEKRIKNVR